MIAMEVNGDVAMACSGRPPRRARVGLVLAFAVAPALEVLENSRKLRATKSFKILKIPRPTRQFRTGGTSTSLALQLTDVELLGVLAGWHRERMCSEGPDLAGRLGVPRKQRQPIFAER